MYWLGLTLKKALFLGGLLISTGILGWAVTSAAAQLKAAPPIHPPVEILALAHMGGAPVSDWLRAESQIVFAFDRLLPHQATSIEVRMTRSVLRTLISLIRSQTYQPPPPAMLAARAIASMEEFGHPPSLSGREALRNLFEAAASGLISAIDQYSKFVPPIASRDRRARLFGEVFDIGLNLELTEGGMLVRNVIAERRAGQAGILPGDVLLSVGDASLSDIDIETAAVFLDSLSNQDLVAAVRRPGNAEPLYLSMPRVRVAGASSESRRVGDMIYIKLHSFNRDASEMIEREIIFSGGAGPGRSRGVILDLRGNGGGYLDQGALIANAFLDSGVIVTVMDQNPAHSSVFSAGNGDLANGLPMIVLIDRFSASAAEIVAAALQDNHRALIIGAPSTGKGTVQTTHSLGELGAAHLTTGRFFRPSGAWLQNNPVIPDLILDAASTEKRWPGGGVIAPQHCPALQGATDPWIACAAGVLNSGTIDKFLSPLIKDRASG